MKLDLLSTPEISPVVHTKGISAHGSVWLFTVRTAGPHEEWGHTAEGRKIVNVFTGVRDGGSLVLSALPFTLSLLLGLRRGRETFQLNTFKLTVCKLFKTTQIYWRKGRSLPGQWERAALQGQASRELSLKASPKQRMEALRRFLTSLLAPFPMG